MLKKTINTLVLLVVLFVVALFGLHFYIRKNTKNRIHHQIEELNEVYTGIVLGASVRPDKSLSKVLKDRVDGAHKAYQEGKIKRFLLSGDHGEKYYDEVNAMKDYLNQKGVPDKDIFLDHAGFDTYDTMYRAKHIFGVNKAVVFTQAFHLPRALYIGQSFGLDLQGYAADKHAYPGQSNFERREWLANVKAWVELNIDKAPTFAGKSIPITGDSSQTHDKK